MTCSWSWADTALIAGVGAVMTSISFLFGQARGWRQGWDDAQRKERRDG